jgi:hypothetical protein
MPAHVPDRVEAALDIGQQYPHPINRDAFHAPGGNVGGAGDGNEAVGRVIVRNCHCERSEAISSKSIRFIEIASSRRSSQ